MQAPPVAGATTATARDRRARDTHPAAGRPSNPFATRYLRAGLVPPLDPDGRPVPVTALAGRVGHARIMALVGPHGSGKSNLLATLAAVIARDRRCILLRAGAGSGVIGRLPRGGVACIDGWERLGLFRCWGIRIAAWCRGASLVVTCHRALGLPVLARCTTSPALLTAVVAALPSHGGRITPADIAAAFARRRGNIREALFDLYDRFEERVREPADTAAVAEVTTARVVAKAGGKFTIAPS